MIIRESRKSFLFVYLIAAVMAGLVVWVLSKGVAVGKMAWMFSLGTIGVGLLLPEFSRRVNYCKVYDNRITIHSGLLNRKQESFYLATITDLAYNQNIWQKLLNYGPIIVRTASHAGKEIKVGKINKPKKIIHELESMVDKQVNRGAPVRANA